MTKGFNSNEPPKAVRREDVGLFIVKFLGWLMKTKKEETAAPPPPTKEQELLTEIRDLLKARG
jgi:hypothetical protein